MESIGALMESASATVEGLRQQTRAGLEFALEEHKTVNAKLDLQAPLIIIPESCTETNTNCLILDAGHVAMTSDLVKRADIGEIQAKQNHKYSEEDWKQLESLMYDKFRLTLESTQVCLLRNNEKKRKLIAQGSYWSFDRRDCCAVASGFRPEAFAYCRSNQY